MAACSREGSSVADADHVQIDDVLGLGGEFCNFFWQTQRGELSAPCSSATAHSAATTPRPRRQAVRTAAKKCRRVRLSLYCFERIHRVSPNEIRG